MIYDFHPDAQQELEDAVAYYDSINPELAHAFLDEIEHTLERIIKFPEAWSKLSANTRRCRMMGISLWYYLSNKKSENCGDSCNASTT